MWRQYDQICDFSAAAVVSPGIRMDNLAAFVFVFVLRFFSKERFLISTLHTHLSISNLKEKT